MQETEATIVSFKSTNLKLLCEMSVSVILIGLSAFTDPLAADVGLTDSLCLQLKATMT